jgi:hypothetical protein
MYAGLYTGGSDDPEVLAGNGQPFLSANQAIALRTVVNGRNASITSSPRTGRGRSMSPIGWRLCRAGTDPRSLLDVNRCPHPARSG